MRFFHVADLHQGLVTNGSIDPKTGLNSRLLDVGRCWHRAAEIAVERATDLMVVAGDTFHTANPTAASENLFRDGLRILGDAGIPTVIIAGNHDRAPHPGQRSIIEIFDDRPSVYAVTRPEVVDIDGMRVACLPSVSRHQLMAMHPEWSRDRANQELTEGLVATLGMLRAESAHVLTLHWSIQGTVLDNDMDMSLVGDAEPVLPLAELEGPWAYIAAGHIHNAQEFPGGWYAGSIDRMNFGEEGEPKYALEVEVASGGGFAVTPHELPARRFLTIDVGDEDFDGFDPRELQEAIVRLRVPGDQREDVPMLISEARDLGAQHVRVEVENVREIRARAENVKEDLGPPEALEEWFVAAGIPEIERPTLRDYAKQLMETIG